MACIFAKFTSVTKATALSGESNALSFCFEFDGENINNIEVMQSRVNVTNTTYDEVDQWLVSGSNENLAKIQAIGVTHKAFRDSRGSINLHLPNVEVRFIDGKASVTPPFEPSLSIA
jgi:exoribonuclease R